MLSAKKVKGSEFGQERSDLIGGVGQMGSDNKGVDKSC